MRGRIAVSALVACSGLTACAPSVQTTDAATASSGHLAASSSVSPAATTDATRRDIAQQLATRLLAEVQLPPGAQAQQTAPASALAGPGATQVSTNLVQAYGWFALPGTEQSVLAFAAAHPLPGFTSSGLGRSNGPGFSEEDEQFTGVQTAEYGPPIIDVEATAQGGYVAVRVNVGVIWRPARTAAEQLPETVTDATATLITSDPPQTIRLDQASARTFATMLNTLDAELPAERSCPPTPTMMITFTIGGRKVVFDAGPCGSVVVTAGGVPQPALAEYTTAGDSTLADELNALFGIVNSPQALTEISSAPAVSSPTAPAGSQPAVEASVRPTPGSGH